VLILHSLRLLRSAPISQIPVLRLADDFAACLHQVGSGVAANNLKHTTQSVEYSYLRGVHLIEGIPMPEASQTLPRYLERVSLYLNKLRKLSPVGYSSKRCGSAYSHMKVDPASDLKLLSGTSGGSTELLPHSDYSYFRLGRPVYTPQGVRMRGSAAPNELSLLCFSGHAGAQTGFARLEDMLPRLDRRTIEMLQKPLFVMPYGSGFTCASNGQQVSQSIVKPVLYRMGHGLYREWFMQLEHTQVETKNALARDALRRVEDAYHASAQFVTLKAGDFFAFPNLQGLHSRTAFQPSLDDGVRYVMRQNSIFGSYMPDYFAGTPSPMIYNDTGRALIGWHHILKV
jgi:hypothetical protein